MSITIETQKPHKIIRNVIEIRINGGEKVLRTSDGTEYNIYPGQVYYFKPETISERAAAKFNEVKRLRRERNEG